MSIVLKYSNLSSLTWIILRCRSNIEQINCLAVVVWSSVQRARLQSDDPSSNPTEVYDISVNFLMKKMKIKQKRPWLAKYLRNHLAWPSGHTALVAASNKFQLKEERNERLIWKLMMKTKKWQRSRTQKSNYKTPSQLDPIFHREISDLSNLQSTLNMIGCCKSCDLY